MTFTDITFLFIILFPCAITLVAILDIFKSKFKENKYQYIFTALVILIPVVGSVIYLGLSKNYKLK